MNHLIRRIVSIAALAIWAAVLFPVVTVGQVPSTIDDFFMPGSQPGESGNLESPDKCDNCHGGYDIAVEPAFNWRGSMMAHALRDPLFYATMSVANQDAPESGDLCIRCHSPQGWLEGRSTPTDGSALTTKDRESVMCDFCHKLVKPTELGVNPYPDDPDYTSGTYDADQDYLSSMTAIPAHSANGNYICDASNAKRGPFVDANARHQMFYSPFHPEAALCGTCHDVSNPAFTRDASGKYLPNEFGQPAPSFDLRDMFPVERTYSEWLVSEYNSEQGVYAPQFGGNKDTVFTCQDCHMRDVTGYGCNKSGTPERDDLPFHDMTGGNAFIPTLIDQVFPGETDPAALDSGMSRVHRMLQLAASMDLTVSDDPNPVATVTVTNETAHKLPSGYPEGRRIWVNVQAYDSVGTLVYESCAYDTSTGVLTHDIEAKIYEIKPGLSQTLAGALGLTAGPSFHFVLNDSVYSDNRIPPRGFNNSAFDSIQSPPVNYSYADGQYWDESDYALPQTAAQVMATLYYQTTSKEYVEFLRDENTTDDWGNTMYNLWSDNGKSPPVAMVADTFYITQPQVNYPPELDSIGPQSGFENALLQFTVTATDPNGSIPELSAAQLPTGANFTDNEDGSGLFEWMPTYDQSGQYDVIFYATDDSAAVDSETVLLDIANVNRAPTVDTVPDQTIQEGDLLEFFVTAVDPDTDSLSLSAGNLPQGASFTDLGWDPVLEKYKGQFSWQTDTSDAGTYDSVTFVATDGDLSGEQYMSIDVADLQVNYPPELDSIGPQSGFENALLQFTVTATDPNGSIPELSAAQLPTGANFTDNEDGSGLFEWMPTFDQSGQYDVIFYATDDSAAVDSESVLLDIANVNRAPSVDAVPDQSIQAGDLLEFFVTAVDPDADSLSLSAGNLPEGASFTDLGWDPVLEKYKGQFSWQTDAADAGTYDSVSFTATDGDLSAEQHMSIIVNPGTYICGDADQSGGVDIDDAVFIVTYIFNGGPAPVPIESGDTNCSGSVDIDDVVFLVTYIFGGGPEPCDTNNDGEPDC